MITLLDYFGPHYRELRAGLLATDISTTARAPAAAGVMIHFDQETRAQLVERLCRFTAPGGDLFSGHAETIRCGGGRCEYVCPAVDRKLPYEG